MCLWERTPLKLLLTFPLWHHSVWCMSTITIHSNLLYFFIDFLFTCLWYAPQRMWCCNWQEKSLYPTLTWCFYLFYHFQNENRRQTKQLDFPLRHFPRYAFFPVFVSLCTLNAEQHTSFIFSLYLVYVLHHFNCFQTPTTAEKKKLWPKTASEKARKFLLFSLVSYSIQS